MKREKSLAYDIVQKQELKHHLIFCSVIFILTFAVYFNSLKSSFIYDDRVTIVENNYIKDFKNISYIFTKDYFQYFGETTYRPLCTFSYFIDYYLYSLNTTGYHITNTLFHTLSAILVYLFAFAIFKSSGLSIFRSLNLPSLFVALLFALHPIQTEPVNAISFREDLIAMTFFLLSILAFVRSVNSSDFKKYLYYALSLFSFTLGIFSKETTLILPLVLLLYDFTFVGKNIREIIKRKFFYLGFFVILLFYFYITRFVLYNTNFLQKLNYPGDSIIITLLTMSKVFVYYLKNLILPISLYANYVIPLSYSIFEPAVISSIAIIVLLFVIAIKLYKTHKVVSFGIFYFFITLLPVSNIISIGHLMADRYLYMPSFGFCLILSYTLLKLLKNKTIMIATFSFILVFYSFFTVRQNILWQDEIVLTKRIIEKFPDSFYANNYLGTIYVIKKNNLDEAIKYLEKTIQLNPKFAGAYNNRGIAYNRKGLLDKAISDFDKAIQLNPKFTIAYYNRGIAYLNKGLGDLAIKDFKKSAELGNEHAIKILKEYFNIK